MISIPRRVLIKAAGSCAAVMAAPGVRAQSHYPSKPIQIVIGFPPGGTSDLVVRYVAQRMMTELKQPVIVMNRPPAGGRPAIAAVARSPADGYTFVHGYAGTFSINPGLYRDKLEYSPEKDFVPVAALFTAAQILVINPSIPARTVAEFVRYAKANPDKVPFASAGIGSSNHFSGELLKSIGGFDALHVPFNGSAPAHVALIGGHVMWSFDTGNILQHVRSGRLVALGAAVSQRLPALPDLPTIAETYPGFEARTWHGLFAPAGTPPEIVALVNRIVNEAMTAQQGRELLAKTSLDPFAVSPEAFGNFVRADMKKWTEVAVKANIQAPD